MYVTQLSRKEANQLTNINDVIWISIEEPGIVTSRVDNPLINEFPHLRIAFWDVWRPNVMATLYNPDTQKMEDTVMPLPSEEDAQKMVDFIMDNPGKNVVANCYAGISRSGAVASFCANKLGMEWRNSHRAYPNIKVYEDMCAYYDRHYSHLK
jgi:predicted protein tyrosine phosphatase